MFSDKAIDIFRRLLALASIECNHRWSHQAWGQTEKFARLARRYGVKPTMMATSREDSNATWIYCFDCQSPVGGYNWPR